MFARTLAVLGSLILTGLLLLHSPAGAATSSITITAPSPAVGTVSITAKTANTPYKYLTVNLDGTEILRCSTSPCVASWNTRQGSNGVHALAARNIDARNRVRASASITVTVNNDLTPPSVTLSAPATATGSVTLSASASDAGGIAALTVTVDGVPLQATSMMATSAVTSTTSNTNVTWDASTATPGAHSVQAFATDASGNAGSSVPATVVVGTTAPPTVTDDGIYAKPPAPPLPPAGGSYVDPTFGTTILRVTDPTTAPMGVTVNSAAEDSMFNADGTMFYLLPANGGSAFLYTFNKIALQATYAGQWPTTPNSRYVLKADGASWDPTNPIILYAMEPGNIPTRGLWQITFGSSSNPLPATVTLLHDFAQEIPTLGGSNYARVQVSPDSRYFMVTAGTTGGQDAYDYVVVWDRQTGQSRVLHTPDRIPAPSGLHATVLDNTGAYAILSMGDYKRLYVWHWPSDTLSAPLTIGAPTCFGGHKVNGAGVNFNPNTCAGSDVWAVRSLATPDTFSNVLTYPRKNNKVSWYEDSHSTRFTGQSFFETRYVPNFVRGTFVLHSGSVYKIVSYLSASANILPPEDVRYQGRTVPRASGIPTAPNQWFYDAGSDTLYLRLPDSSNPETTKASGKLTIIDWRPMMEEIIQVMQKPDGAWGWRRLAHHRSQYTSFANSPRGNVDPTGSFVLFQSNWDGTLTNADGSRRTDVFLLRVPTDTTP